MTPTLYFSIAGIIFFTLLFVLVLIGIIDKDTLEDGKELFLSFVALILISALWIVSFPIMFVGGAFYLTAKFFIYIVERFND